MSEKICTLDLLGPESEMVTDQFRTLAQPGAAPVQTGFRCVDVCHGRTNAWGPDPRERTKLPASQA